MLTRTCRTFSPLLDRYHLLVWLQLDHLGLLEALLVVPLVVPLGVLPLAMVLDIVMVVVGLPGLAMVHT
jgi:hypothetical protein